MKEIKKTYLAPSVKVMNVQVEGFIAASPTLSTSDENADDSEVLSKENNFNSVWDEDEE